MLVYPARFCFLRIQFINSPLFINLLIEDKKMTNCCYILFESIIFAPK